MKTLENLQKVSIVLMLFLLMIDSSCIKKEEVTTPGLNIYKTKGDYFLYVNTWGKKNAPTTYRANDARIGNLDTDTIYMGRKILISGYILSAENSVDDYFTNITFTEMVKYNDSLGLSASFPRDSVFKRVIDENPYIEFYHDDYHPRRFELKDTAKINQIIRDGELEKYFKRLK
ncbi:MAG: hypothetical protein Q8R96_02115 [Bacteroidota bacterium]|nr:hypothetical protein [Bacteroidota bacterium]